MRPVATSTVSACYCVCVSLCLGLQCVAQCTLDGCWYRAEVLDVRRNDTDMEMSIIFVDYGSCDYISDVSKSVMNILLPIYYSSTIQYYYYYYYTRLTVSFPRQLGQAGTRKVKLVCI